MLGEMKVISLDRTPERFEKFLNINRDIPIGRISACDGSRLERADCIRNGLITETNTYKPGVIGHLMSHVTLWRQCAAGPDPFHIAEDDVILRADFQTAAGRVLDQLVGWDVVLWLSNVDWPVMIRPDGIGSVVMQYRPEEVATHLGSFRMGTTASIPLPLVSAAGNGCYSVSPRGAARMLADCLPVGSEMANYVSRPGMGWTNNGLDVEMSRHYGQWRAYLCVPPLAVAPNDQSESTIRGHLAMMHDPAIANRAIG